MSSQYLGFGQNLVLPEYWDGWGGPLRSAKQDALDWWIVAPRMGDVQGECFTSDYIGRPSSMGHSLAPFILTAQCTVQRFRDSMKAHAERRVNGDSLFICLSGHGGQDNDGLLSGAMEYLVFADGPIYDHELTEILSWFADGVNIVMWMDLCHSGGMDRARLIGLPKTNPRIATVFKERTKHAISANVVQMCACGKNQTALDMKDNGAFTGAAMVGVERYLANNERPAWRTLFNDTLAFTDLHNYAQTPQLNLLGRDPERVLAMGMFG